MVTLNYKCNHFSPFGLKGFIKGISGTWYWSIVDSSVRACTLVLKSIGSLKDSYNIVII